MWRRNLLWSDARVQPSSGTVELDYGSPFADGIEFCVIGAPFDLVAREQGTVVAASGLDPTFGSIDLGRTMVFHGNTSTAQVSGYKFTGGLKRTTWTGVGAATVLVGFRIVTLTNIDQPLLILGLGATGGNAFYVSSLGSLNINNYGNWGIVSTGLTCAAGKSYVAAYSWPETSGDTQVCLNNVSDGTITRATLTGKWSITAGNAATYEIGGANGLTSMNGHVACAMFSRRKMTMAELQTWVVDPYSVVRPILRRRYAVLAAAAADTLMPQAMF